MLRVLEKDEFAELTTKGSSETHRLENMDRLVVVGDTNKIDITDKFGDFDVRAFNRRCFTGKPIEMN